MFQNRTQGIGFARRHIFTTAIFIVLTILFREISDIVGFKRAVSLWVLQVSTPHG
jgi:hypothetical protein